MNVLCAMPIGAWHAATTRWISKWASNLTQSLPLLFRAFGLGILTVVRRRRRREEPKILIYTSILQVVFHSVTHILPIIVSITLIAFNLLGFFIGRELQGEQNLDGLKLGVIQIAAKVQVRNRSLIYGR